MSTRDGNAGIGCLPGLLLILALFAVMAVAGLGSDRVSHDCEGIATCIKEEK